MRNFRELKVWEKAHHLVVAVYKYTAGFPEREAYGLTSQTRRCAVSIPSNIAEGCGRRGDAELAHFLGIAMGSASELEYYVLLTRELGMLPESAAADLAERVVEVKRMLAAFLQKLNPPEGRPT
jgi:four helix bundle protein